MTILGEGQILAFLRSSLTSLQYLQYLSCCWTWSIRWLPPPPPSGWLFSSSHFTTNTLHHYANNSPNPDPLLEIRELPPRLTKMHRDADCHLAKPQRPTEKVGLSFPLCINLHSQMSPPTSQSHRLSENLLPQPLMQKMWPYACQAYNLSITCLFYSFNQSSLINRTTLASYKYSKSQLASFKMLTQTSDFLVAFHYSGKPGNYKRTRWPENKKRNSPVDYYDETSEYAPRAWWSIGRVWGERFMKNYA